MLFRSRSPPGEAAAFVVGARVVLIEAVAPASSGESVEAGGAARMWSCGPRSVSRMVLTAKRFRRDCGAEGRGLAGAAEVGGWDRVSGRRKAPVSAPTAMVAALIGAVPCGR